MFRAPPGMLDVGNAAQSELQPTERSLDQDE